MMRQQIRTTGAIVIRSAESRPRKVVSSAERVLPVATPTTEDITLARAVRTHKRTRGK